MTEITRARGLPDGVLGKITIDVSGADSRRLYAVIEAKAQWRVHVGDALTFLFENALSIRYQVQEMMLAEKIVKYREKNGDFQVIEELLQVDGFSRDLLRKIKGFLLLEGIGGEECTC